MSEETAVCVHCPLDTAAIPSAFLRRAMCTRQARSSGPAPSSPSRPLCQILSRGCGLLGETHSKTTTTTHTTKRKKHRRQNKNIYYIPRAHQPHNKQKTNHGQRSTKNASDGVDKSRHPIIGGRNIRQHACKAKQNEGTKDRHPSFLSALKTRQPQ